VWIRLLRPVAADDAIQLQRFAEQVPVDTLLLYGVVDRLDVLLDVGFQLAAEIPRLLERVARVIVRVDGLALRQLVGPRVLVDELRLEPLPQVFPEQLGLGDLLLLQVDRLLVAGERCRAQRVQTALNQLLGRAGEQFEQREVGVLDVRLASSPLKNSR
jgi:hypothetical protein